MEINTDILLSMITGLFVAVLIYFFGGFNIQYRGPDSNIVRKKVYTIDNKCFMFEPVVHICR
jgi:hypothetical protein